MHWCCLLIRLEVDGCRAREVCLHLHWKPKRLREDEVHRGDLTNPTDSCDSLYDRAHRSLTWLWPHVLIHQVFFVWSQLWSIGWMTEHVYRNHRIVSWCSYACNRYKDRRIPTARVFIIAQHDALCSILWIWGKLGFLIAESAAESAYSLHIGYWPVVISLKSLRASSAVITVIRIADAGDQPCSFHYLEETKRPWAIYEIIFSPLQKNRLITIIVRHR